MEKVQVTNIELKVGKNKFNLSFKEAHELRDILKETFPEKEYVYLPSQPIFVPMQHPLYDQWQVHYEITSGTLTLSTT